MRRLTLPKILKWIMVVMAILFALLTVYRLIFFYQYRSDDRPFTGSAFILGARYDMRVVCVTGLLLVLLSFIPRFDPFRNTRVYKIWLGILSVIFLVYILFIAADYYHYDYLQQRLNASVLNFLEDAAISLKMMWESYPVLLIIGMLGIVVFLFAFVCKKTFFAITANTGNPVRKRWIPFTVFILICAIFIFGQLGQYPLRWSDAFRFADDFKANVSLNPFQSFFSTLKFRKSTYDLKKVKEGYPAMAAYLGASPDINALNFTRVVNYADTFTNKPNVIIVICESFSAYKSSMFGNKLDPTPYFASLCNNGVFYERCFVPTFGTARGVWATITGVPDVETPKTASRNPSAVDQHTIINDFRSHEKFYFLGGSTTWANIRGVLTNNIEGLTIYEEEHFKAKKVDVWGISDKNLFLEANRILAERSKPFFAIIQTADNHRPYTIPKEDIGEFKKVSYDEDTLTKYGFSGNDELNAFRYTDFCFRKFMDAAQKEPYFKNTIFVFVGDHGLRGDAGNMFPKSFTEQGILAQHVPMLFYGPAYLKPKRIKQVSSQSDILPTVASITRQPHYNTTLGMDLTDSLRKQRYSFIADPDLHTIGLVSDSFYYRKNLKTGLEEFVSVVSNENADIPSNLFTRKQMAIFTEAWYNTARYMLLNNKKKKR